MPQYHGVKTCGAARRKIKVREIAVRAKREIYSCVKPPNVDAAIFGT
jgi:hypothetical protein